MIDRSAYPVHADLLDQVADSTEERDNVRRILGEPFTGADHFADASKMIAEHRRATWPIAPANHAHRYSACASGPCQGGRKLCPSPEACMRADEPRPQPRAGDLVLAAALFLGVWAAIVLTLIASGVRL